MTVLNAAAGREYSADWDSSFFDQASFVCAADRFTKIVHLQDYRPLNETGIRAKLWQAALATSAATTFFEPVSTGDRVRARPPIQIAALMEIGSARLWGEWKS
jgi:hypothetical protein